MPRITIQFEYSAKDLVSPPRLTDRQTTTFGGRGGVADPDQPSDTSDGTGGTGRDASDAAPRPEGTGLWLV
jgi:hypothetical protein